MKKVFLLVIPLALVVIFAGYALTLPKPEEKPIVETATSTPEVVVPQTSPEIIISPNTIIQGEPAMVRVDNLSGTTTARSLTFNGKRLGVFMHNGDPSALIGIDLRMAPGSYPVVVLLSDGTSVRKNLIVGKRPLVEAPLGIPDSLGGNTPEAEKELVATLAQEGAIINSIKSEPEKFWNGSFRLPLDGNIVVTDTYGYSRQTGASTIAHKGTDFRASVGTAVYAMNRGEVRFKDYFRNYGNVVVIDHGFGLLTIYMHLSEITVELGNMVEKGELIAKSGNTGYVLGPHLHLTVRIDQISIDPQKFMELLGN